jgi:uncharacterized phage protein gp47/JayE
LKSVEELYRQMTADFVERTGMTMVDSCDLAARMYALAAQIYALQVHSDWVRRQCFPQTAVGENLDHHARMRSLERKSATCAEGVVRFFAAESSELVRTVPAGTVCMTPGLVRFETQQDGYLMAGEMWVDVPVRAVEAGAGGNAAAGTVTEMAVAPVGIVSCSNPDGFAGGVDEEDDESLRQRVLYSFRYLPNGANAAYYRQLAMADEEVAQAAVISRPRGVGTVDVVVASHAGVPGEELLSRLRVQMEQEREIAVDLVVRAPETVEVSVAVEVAAKNGYDAEAVRQRVKNALSDYFSGEILGEDVLRARLGSVVYSCEGVENYRITMPGEDIRVEQAQLPVLTELTVEAMA